MQLVVVCEYTQVPPRGPVGVSQRPAGTIRFDATDSPELGSAVKPGNITFLLAFRVLPPSPSYMPVRLRDQSASPSETKLILYNPLIHIQKRPQRGLFQTGLNWHV